MDTEYNRESTVKVHTTISSEFDDNAAATRELQLKDCTDEQLIAEVARRGLDIHHTVTEDLVKQTYKFEKSLGSGASGKSLVP
jgi:hypothetical protein